MGDGRHLCRKWDEQVFWLWKFRFFNHFENLNFFDFGENFEFFWLSGDPPRHDWWRHRYCLRVRASQVSSRASKWLGLWRPPRRICVTHVILEGHRLNCYYEYSKLCFYVATQRLVPVPPTPHPKALIWYAFFNLFSTSFWSRFERILGRFGTPCWGHVGSFTMFFLF